MPLVARRQRSRRLEMNGRPAVNLADAVVTIRNTKATRSSPTAPPIQAYMNHGHLQASTNRPARPSVAETGYRVGHLLDLSARWKTAHRGAHMESILPYHSAGPPRPGMAAWRLSSDRYAENNTDEHKIATCNTSAKHGLCTLPIALGVASLTVATFSR